MEAFNSKNNWMKIIIVFLLLIISVGFCAYVGFETCLSKRLFHLDESLSYSLSNEPRLGWLVYETTDFVTKNYFADYGVTYAPFNYSQVIANQANDVHPPLFYLILHTICSLHPNEVSIWHGLSINYFSYLLNVFLVFMLVYYLSKKPILAFLSSLIYGLNPSILQGLIFIRMYQLTSTWIILFVFVAALIANQKDHIFSRYIWLFLITIGGG